MAKIYAMALLICASGQSYGLSIPKTTSREGSGGQRRWRALSRANDLSCRRGHQAAMNASRASNVGTRRELFIVLKGPLRAPFLAAKTGRKRLAGPHPYKCVLTPTHGVLAARQLRR